MSLPEPNTEEEEEEEEEEFKFKEDDEFSFVVSQDGNISTRFPLFDKSIMLCGVGEEEEEEETEEEEEEVIVELGEEVVVGPYCEWSSHRRKSNSTGFSKLWRLKGIMHRSKSEGKHAYVLVSDKVGRDRRNGSSSTVVASRPHRGYFLPYRKDLIGFFTNVSGLTRNVHPY